MDKNLKYLLILDKKIAHIFCFCASFVIHSNKAG